MKTNHLINALKAIISIIAAILVYGCSYDDSALQNRVDEIDSRLTELEQTVRDMNTNLGSLMTAVTALQNQDQIVSVVPLEDGTGYTVTFSKSGTITIKNGTDGADGVDGNDGQTPVISVRLEDDGLYYWTVNGELLLDDQGNKIPATSKSAVPQIRVNEGNFEISFDGQKWEIIGSAGNAGIFKDVQDGTDCVTFVLADGNTIVIPKVQEFALVIENTQIPVTPGATAMVSYSIAAADEGTVIEVLTTEGFKASVQYTFADDVSKGTIAIEVPDPLTSGKVFVFAVNSKGITSTKILSFEEGMFEAMCFDELNLPSAGGIVTIMVSTNYDYEVFIPEDATSWITSEIFEVKSVREEDIILTVAENTGEARSAVISLLSGATMHYSLTITQEAKIVEEAGYKGAVDDWENDGSLDL